MTHPIFFHATIIAKHQKRFHFQMPQRIKQRCRTATHAALRTRFHRCLKHFEKRNTTRMLCFTATNGATHSPNTPCVNADARPLRHIFHNRRSGCVNRIQTVIALNQHARTKLTGRRANPRHNWCRQRNFEQTHRIIEFFYIIQSFIFGILREQTHCHKHIQKLRTFKHLLGNTVLHQVFAFQLLDCRIRKIHITAMANILI